MNKNSTDKTYIAVYNICASNIFQHSLPVQVHYSYITIKHIRKQLKYYINKYLKENSFSYKELINTDVTIFCLRENKQIRVFNRKLKSIFESKK